MKQFTEEFLYDEYINKNKSSREIASENGIGSHHAILTQLRKFNIKKEHWGKNRSSLSKDILEHHYVVLKQTMKQIAREFHVAPYVVRRSLCEVGIEIRRSNQIYIPTTSRLRAWQKHRGGYEEISGHYWSAIVCSARKRNIDFNIDIETCYDIFIKQDKKCALSGVPIRFKLLGEHITTQTASLDRIDSNKPYTNDNIQWVHKIIQLMKNKLSTDEFLTWCQTVTENNK